MHAQGPMKYVRCWYMCVSLTATCREALESDGLGQHHSYVTALDLCQVGRGKLTHMSSSVLTQLSCHMHGVRV